MSTAFQKVSNILQRNQMIQSQNEEEINKAFEMINDEASFPEPFPYMGDHIICVSKEKEVRWLNAFYSDDTNLLKIYNNCLSTETMSWGNDCINMSNITSHIIMAIISHEHTNTLKFILSELNMFHSVHINSIYYAALCSENIPIIKQLQQTFDDNIDIYMIEGLILNKKYDIIQLLFSDEKKIKDNNIIGSVIEYAFDFNNKDVLDIIVQLASIYMPDYTEYENEQLALRAFIQRNINASELIRSIYEKNYLSAIENKEVSTDILDYLVDMKVKAVDVSKIIRLCAQLKQRTLNTEHNYDHLIDYVFEFVAPDAYIDLNYMANLQTYQNSINDGLTYILKNLQKKNIPIRLTFENFNPLSLYDFKTSELRILLKYCIPETIDITSENSIMPLLIENDKYTILDDIIKSYKLSQAEFDYLIEMCVRLKKVKCLNVVRKYYQK